MNLHSLKKVYCVGVKGIGMTAAAQILKNHNVEVSGSDTSERFFTDAVLKRAGIPVFESFDATRISPDIGMLLYSTAYGAEHSEIARARELNIPVMSYPEFVGMLSREKLSVAVCGTHGKTTTTAMLASSFLAAGADPSAIVGSEVMDWKGGALSGRGNYFVFEADEYQDKFQFFSPWSAVLTSIDWDHPDFFPTPESYRGAFEKFVAKIPAHGFLVVCADDTDALAVAERSRAQKVSYGFSENAEYKVIQYTAWNTKQENQKFSILSGGENLGEFSLLLPGKHNALNAAAVVALCHRMKIDLENVREGLANFHGTARRFEVKGEYNGAILVDDYAHHPAEIRATISAARDHYSERKIIAIFQPHTFSRTKALLEEFAQSFEEADAVLLLPIYASAREAAGTVSSEDLAARINRYFPKRAAAVGTIEKAAAILRDSADENDVVISLGAGNGWEVLEALSRK